MPFLPPLKIKIVFVKTLIFFLFGINLMPAYTDVATLECTLDKNTCLLWCYKSPVVHKLVCAWVMAGLRQGREVVCIGSGLWMWGWMLFMENPWQNGRDRPRHHYRNLLTLWVRFSTPLNFWRVGPYSAFGNGNARWWKQPLLPWSSLPHCFHVVFFCSGCIVWLETLLALLSGCVTKQNVFSFLSS